MQTLAVGKYKPFLADKQLTVASEFPSNPADVIKSATLEFVLTNLAFIRLADGYVHQSNWLTQWALVTQISQTEIAHTVLPCKVLLVGWIALARGNLPQPL